MSILPTVDRRLRRSRAVPRRVPAIAGAAAVLLALAGCAAVGGTSGGAAARDSEGTANPGDRPVIGLQHEGPVRVVYQISADEWKEGVGKGLLYLKKVHEQYVDAGVDPDRLDIRGVFHGTAADHLLTDAAWNAWRGESGGNPNRELIAELAGRGVAVELCDTRRQANGWSKDDVHPDVLLVTGAYQRVIDLQLEGFAYVRF